MLAKGGQGGGRGQGVQEAHRGGGDVWTRLERWVGLGGRAGRPGWACSTVRSRRGSPAARHISERPAPISPNAPRPPAALLRGHVALDAPSPHACGSDLPWTWPIWPQPILRTDPMPPSSFNPRGVAALPGPGPRPLPGTGQSRSGASGPSSSRASAFNCRGRSEWRGLHPAKCVERPAFRVRRRRAPGSGGRSQVTP